MKKKYLIVVADYYKDITIGLIKSALKKIPPKNIIKIIKVPGAFEIPVTISKNLKKYDGFLALGCVIKGNTPHFNLICNATFNAILELSISHNKPITNGIITAFNLKQAKERCGLIRSNKPNKGVEAARALVCILNNGTKKI